MHYLIFECPFILNPSIGIILITHIYEQQLNFNLLNHFEFTSECYKFAIFMSRHINVYTLYYNMLNILRGAFRFVNCPPFPFCPLSVDVWPTVKSMMICKWHCDPDFRSNSNVRVYRCELILGDPLVPLHL